MGRVEVKWGVVLRVLVLAFVFNLFFKVALDDMTSSIWFAIYLASMYTGVVNIILRAHTGAWWICSGTARIDIDEKPGLGGGWKTL